MNDDLQNRELDRAQREWADRREAGKDFEPLRRRVLASLRADATSPHIVAEAAGLPTAPRTSPQACWWAAACAVWAHPLEDGLLAVESRLKLDDPALPEFSFNGVQKSGEPTQVQTLRRGGVEYVVFQTVTVLSRKS